MGNVMPLQADPKSNGFNPVQKDGSTDLALFVRTSETDGYNRINLFLMAQADLRGIIYKGKIIVTQSCDIGNCTM